MWCTIVNLLCLRTAYFMKMVSNDYPLYFSCFAFSRSFGQEVEFERTTFMGLPFHGLTGVFLTRQAVFTGWSLALILEYMAATFLSPALRDAPSTSDESSSTSRMLEACFPDSIVSRNFCCCRNSFSQKFILLCSGLLLCI